MDNVLILTVLGSNVNTELNVGAVNLSGHSLTDIVEKTGSASLSNVNAHFLCNNTCEHGNLDRVAKGVLTVRGTVLHTAKELNKLGMETVNTCLEDCLLTGLLDFKLNVTASLLNHLLNSCGMDTAVADKLLKSDACDLTSNRVKARNGNNVGCVVNNKLNAGKILDGTDISTLTTDDSTLHLVTGDLNNRDCDLADMICGEALNCERKNVTSLGISLVLKSLLIFCNLKSSLMLHLGVETSNKLCLCLIAGKTCDLLKHCKLSLKGLANLFTCLVCIGKLFGKESLLLLKLLKLCVKGLFLLGISSFLSGNFLTTLINVAVSFLLQLENLFLCGNDRFLLCIFCILNGIFKNLSRLLFSRANLLFSAKFTNNKSDNHAHDKGSNYQN